ncbi:SpaA isopeptide-forming pilin-related protein [Corynebacterium striatum]
MTKSLQRKRYGFLRRLSAALLVPLVSGSLIAGPVVAGAQEGSELDVDVDATVSDSLDPEDDFSADDSQAIEQDPIDADADSVEQLEMDQSEADGLDTDELEFGELMQPMAVRAGQSSDLKCEAGTFYALHQWGEVLEFNVDGSGNWGRPIIKRPGFNFRNYSGKVSGWNGLGITSDGKTAYAYRRTGQANDGLDGGFIIGRADRYGSTEEKSYKLHRRLSLVTGAVAPDNKYYFGGYFVYGQNYEKEAPIKKGGGDVIQTEVYANTRPAGATRLYSDDKVDVLGLHYKDPNDGNRKYYIGADRDSFYPFYNDGRFYKYYSPEVRADVTATQGFRLYSYDGTSVKHVGDVPIWNSTAKTAVNGDIAFDPAGNLYILYNPSGYSQYKIVPVVAENLGSSNGGQIDSQSANTLNLPDAVVAGRNTYPDGIAFLANGELVIEFTTEYANDNKATFVRVDPATGMVLGPTKSFYQSWDTAAFENGGSTYWGFGGQTDLASCANFSTLKLLKDLPKGRAAKGDQFQLEIHGDTGAQQKWDRLTWNVTSGNQNGVQSRVAGPIVARQGKTFRLSEVASADPGYENAKLEYYTLNEKKAPRLECVDQGGVSLPSANIKPVPDSETQGLNDERAWDVTVPEGEAKQISCTITNEPYRGDLRWTKVARETDPETGSSNIISLGGSVWSLLDAAGDVIPGYRGISYENFADCDPTDKDCEAAGADSDTATGKFRVTALPYGTYYLREDVAPKGYEKLAEPIKFTFDRDGIHYDSFNELSRFDKDTNSFNLGRILNEKLQGSVKWDKVDPEKDNLLLGGSEWKLYKKNGNEKEQPGVLIEDNTGQEGYTGRDTNKLPGAFEVKGLDFGTWVIEETKAPEGYRNTQPKYEFDVTEDKPEATVGEQGRVNNYKGRIEWEKVDAADDEKRLAGSEWKLTYNPSDPNGKATEVIVKDCVKAPCAKDGDLDPDPGKFSVYDLGEGEYSLEEQKAPEGYLAEENLKFTVVVDANGYSVSKDGHANLKLMPYTVENNAVRIPVGKIANTKDEATVTWNKVDSADTAEFLGGSEWKIQRKNDKGEWTDAYTVVDNATDQLKDEQLKDEDSAEGKFKVTIPTGDYRLVETKAPQDYIITEELKQGKEFSLTRENLSENLSLGNFVNDKVESDVTWTKVDAEDKAQVLAGSEWTLTPLNSDSSLDEDNKIVIVDSGKNDADDRAGYLKVEKLGGGKYQLKETKAPEGYAAADKTWDVEVNAETIGKVIQLGPVENKPIKGAVSWTKVQADKTTLLAGSEWSLVQVDDKDQPIKGTELEVTDCEQAGCAGPDADEAPGKFLVKDLKAGKYKLVESKAPAGYKLDATEHYFEIKDDGTSEEVVVAGSFVNELGKGIELPLTGGRGAYLYQFLGALLGVLAAAMGGAHVMRRRNS